MDTTPAKYVVTVENRPELTRTVIANSEQEAWDAYVTDNQDILDGVDGIDIYATRVEAPTNA